MVEDGPPFLALGAFAADVVDYAGAVIRDVEVVLVNTGRADPRVEDVFAGGDVRRGVDPFDVFDQTWICQDLCPLVE